MAKSTKDDPAGVVGLGLFAFWRYDSYPYILGGHVTKILDGGAVQTLEYGPGYYFRPLLLLPAAEGETLLASLMALRDRKRKAEKDFHALWDVKLLEGLGGYADQLLSHLKGGRDK